MIERDTDKMITRFGKSHNSLKESRVSVTLAEKASALCVRIEWEEKNHVGFLKKPVERKILQ